MDWFQELSIPAPRRAIGKFKVEEALKSQNEKDEPKLDFPEGLGEQRIQTKTQSMGRVQTFSGRTDFPFLEKCFLMTENVPNDSMSQRAFGSRWSQGNKIHRAGEQTML